MKNIIVIPNEKFSKEEIIEFVKSYGGYWVKESGIDHGVINKNRFHIYVSYCENVNQEYEPDEIKRISSHFGYTPTIFIDIHISWAENSFLLAKDLPLESFQSGAVFMTMDAKRL